MKINTEKTKSTIISKKNKERNIRLQGKQSE